MQDLVSTIVGRPSYTIHMYFEQLTMTIL